MKTDNHPAKIILIHGPSSAGKTTLAVALQSRFEVPFLRFSFDFFMESGVLPMAGIKDGSLPWRAMRPAVFDGFHRCLAALASAGNNLIVDHIVETPAWMADLVGLLSPYDVFFVGLHCSLPELERREKMRGDRRPGEARADFESAHQFASYDLELDGEAALESNLDSLMSAWKQRRQPGVFARMADTVPTNQEAAETDVK